MTCMTCRILNNRNDCFLLELCEEIEGKALDGNFLLVLFVSDLEQCVIRPLSAGLLWTRCPRTETVHNDKCGRNNVPGVSSSRNTSASNLKSVNNDPSKLEEEKVRRMNRPKYSDHFSQPVRTSVCIRIPLRSSSVTRPY